MEKNKRIAVLLLLVAFAVGVTMVKSWAFDDDYNSTTPLDGESFKDGASRIREFKRGWEQRWSVNHVVRDADTNNIYSDTTTTDTEGMHYKVDLVDRDEPDTHAYGGTVYGSGGHCWFKRQDGNTVRMDSFAKHAATLVIAAADSKYTIYADYICDGTADQVEIEEAIAALPSVGGRILLLEGNFNISDSVNIDSPIIFEGQGWSTIIAAADAMNVSIIIVETDDVVIKNLKLDGNFAGQTSDIAHGIKVYNGVSNQYSVQIINCYLYDIKSVGVWITDTNYYAAVSGCRFLRCGLDSLIVDGSRHIIVNNFFRPWDISKDNIDVKGDYCVVSNNNIYDDNNTGSDIGIRVAGDYNIISTNSLYMSANSSNPLYISGDNNQILGDCITSDTYILITSDANKTYLFCNVSTGGILNNGTNTDTTSTNVW